MKKLFLVPILFVAYSTLDAMDATPPSKDKKPDGWTGEDYNKASDPQYRSAMGVITARLTAAPYQNEQWLDLGCGTGRISVELARRTTGNVIGVDASESQIATAKELWKQQSNLSFAVLDGQNLPYENLFDDIFSFAAIHWMDGKSKVFNGCYRALKPGGQLLFTIRAKDPEQVLRLAFIRTAQESEWAMLKAVDPDSQDFPVDQQELITLLKTSGFENLDIQERFIDNKFTPDEYKAFLLSLIGATSSIGKLKAEKPDLVKRLIDAIVRNYLTISPLDNEGKLTYHLKALLATAQKPKTQP